MPESVDGIGGGGKGSLSSYGGIGMTSLESNVRGVLVDPVDCCGEENDAEETAA